MLFFFFAPIAAAQEYITTNITTADGLSQNDARVVFQDSSGYIWIATNDGVNRYDGYEFRTYRMGDRGLASNLIRTIAGDANGNMWLGTGDRGIFKYEVCSDVFLHVSNTIDPACELAKLTQLIVVDGEGGVWATNYGRQVYRLSEIEGAYEVKEYLMPMSEVIVRMTTDNQGALLVLTTHGVYRYYQTTESFRPWHDLYEVAHLQWHDGELYLLRDERVWMFDTSGGVMTLMSDILARNMFVSSAGDLWICSDDGIYRKSLRMVPGRVGKEEKVKDGNYLVTNIIEDCFGSLWMGTYRKGLLHFRQNKKPFRTHYPERSVECVHEDSRGRLWAGTVTGEVTVFEGSGYTPRPVIKLHIGTQQPVIHYIGEHRKSNKIYVGTSNGLFRVDASKRELSSYDFEFMPMAPITHMIEDSVYMWLGTYGGGLVRYNTVTDTVEHIFMPSDSSGALPSHLIRYIFQDRSGNLYIATAEGLVIMDSADRFSDNPVFRRPVVDGSTSNILTENHILPIYSSRDDEIWVGTLGVGVCRIVPSADGNGFVSTVYNTRNGLSNNTIKGILEDENGRIWISTSSGLNCIESDPLYIRSFGMSEGLQDFEFCDISYVRRTSGELLFGGVNGFNAFYPESITYDNTKPLLVITDFQLWNKSVDINEQVNGRTVLDHRLASGRQLRLRHNQNSFSFSFSSLHYANPEENRYRYMLRGYDKEWVETSSSNRNAKYTNIAPGKYAFMLAGSNNDHVWSDPIGIDIEVLAPVWARWYAYMVYIMLFSLALFYIMKVIHRRQTEKAEMEMARKEKQYLKNLSEAKMNFFTNISHEFRTPLTLIISPLQKIMANRDMDPGSRDRLFDVMNHNSSILMRLVNQTLDLARHDKERLTLNLGYLDFVEFSRRVFDQFHSLAEQNGIELEFFNPGGAIKVNCDRHQMEEILYNLISNAIKHTPPGGTVSYEVTDEQQSVVIRISDSGKGISDNVKEHIFERFYSVSSEYSNTTGTGIGLSFTKSLVELHGGTIGFNTSPGQGTTFVVSIPKNTFDSMDDAGQQHADGQSVQIFADTGRDADQEANSDVARSTVLVIDDNRDVVEILIDLLSPYYDVLSATDGQTGYEICINRMPSLVVTDVMMPGMNGIELCRLIKSNEITSHIPVVMLTAKGTRDGEQEGLSAFADAYCLKPFDNDILLSTINSIIINRRNMALKFREEFIYSSAEQTVATINNDFLRQLLEIVDEYLEDPGLNIEFVSNKMGLSQITLNKKLRKMTNLTANMFIRNVRLKRAAEMLATGQYTVSEVTYAVGLNDLKYFRECFRREFGMSPSDYIKKS